MAAQDAQQNGPRGAHSADATDRAERTCVLVSSCDAYSDAWPPFFALLNRYWPDCPFPIYLISNHQPGKFDGVTSITLGQDRHWASNMLQVLDQLPFEQFLYFQEDYFLQRPVCTSTVFNVLKFAEETGAGFIR
jgi:hypothetical protein